MAHDSSSFTCDQRFAVHFHYPVVFTRGALSPANRVLLDVVTSKKEARRHRIFFCIDAGALAASPELPVSVRGYCEAHSAEIELVGEPLVVGGGERSKQGWPQVQEILELLAHHRLDRQSYVCVIGGGSVLDVVGLAAALVHRGLRLIRMPTTVLAQNDAGVGVKNGVNAHGQKNFLGTFAPPFAVINDALFLATLDDEHWRGGIAEAFKVAIIKDAAFFDFLCSHADALRRRDLAAMEALIRRCAILHLDHIASQGDPFEMGTARPLDFGHWSAHRIENLSGYRISHGAAVASGVALDTHYAARAGLITRADRDRIIAGLRAVGFRLWHAELEARDSNGELEVLRGLEEFREHLGGVLTITLPDGIGRKKEVHELRRDWIEEGLGFLRGLESRA